MKSKLKLETLEVESFEVEAPAERPGTVRGHDGEPDGIQSTNVIVGCATCGFTCKITCPYTCDDLSCGGSCDPVTGCATGGCFCQ